MFLTSMRAGPNLTMKGKSMNEQEFKQQLDKVVTAGLNSQLDIAFIYGQLSAIKQFVEVVYDTNIVNHLNTLREKQAQEKGSLNDAG